MANIAVTKFCNLKCKYCFADDMISEAEAKYIGLEQYISILQWLAKDSDNHVGIIGGEPTLHPQFEEILKITESYCNRYNATATLFTNGILLSEYVKYLNDRIHILININSPSVIGDYKWNKINDSICELKEAGFENNITIGCNIYPGEANYRFIVNLANKFGFKNIRTAVVAPGGVYKNLIKDRDSYFRSMKPIFIDYVNLMSENDLTIYTDCAQIPDCYFSEEELEKIYNISINRNKRICDPVVDINSDFMATTCFGSYDLIDCRDFDTLTDLKRYMLLRKSINLINSNNCDRCKGCKELELLTCQGGCLGFNKLER